MTVSVIRALVFTVTSSVTVVALLANLSVLVVILKSPNLRSNRSIVFLVHLCFLGCLASVLLLPVTAGNILRNECILTEPWCKAIGFIASLVTSANIFTLCVISIDRCVSIFDPMLHAAKLTKVLCAQTIFSIWMLAGLLAFPPLLTPWSKFEYNNQRYQCSYALTPNFRAYSLTLLAVAYVVPSVVTLSMYAVIFRTARESLNQIRSVTVAVISDDSSSISTTTSKRGSSVEGPPRKVSKAARTVGLLGGLFLAFYAPDIVAQLLESLGVRSGILTYTLWLDYLGYAVQPFLYGYYTRPVREATVQLFKTWCRTKRQEESTNNELPDVEDFFQFLQGTT